mmetsp:Transcript_8748/g.22790  ORF Transcript_8748/g.22790 Transcript_8748/m.22790 type:complete len:208 (-) Transcript_8748:86-709(-)
MSRTVSQVTSLAVLAVRIFSCIVLSMKNVVEEGRPLKTPMEKKTMKSVYQKIFLVCGSMNPRGFMMENLDTRAFLRAYRPSPGLRPFFSEDPSDDSALDALVVSYFEPESFLLGFSLLSWSLPREGDELPLPVSTVRAVVLAADFSTALGGCFELPLPPPDPTLSSVKETTERCEVCPPDSELIIERWELFAAPIGILFRCLRVQVL